MSPLNITQPVDSIRYMVYNGYYKVMSNIPKMGHLPTPVDTAHLFDVLRSCIPSKNVRNSDRQFSVEYESFSHQKAIQ